MPTVWHDIAYVKELVLNVNKGRRMRVRVKERNFSRQFKISISIIKVCLSQNITPMDYVD